MTDEPDMTHDSEATGELGATESRLAERLRDERPVPPAGFRGALGRHLGALDPGYGPRPGRLRLLVGGYIATGAALIAVSALNATGVL
jgi:hypothetical protein